MDKVRYMIGDAASRIQVEAHVLRYWEEELKLSVPRNELGHRYYTEENLKQFEEIKRLKEEGFQLKAIKMLIHNRPSIDELESAETDKLSDWLAEENRSADSASPVQHFAEVSPWDDLEKEEIQKRTAETGIGVQQETASMMWRTADEENLGNSADGNYEKGTPGDKLSENEADETDAMNAPALLQPEKNETPAAPSKLEQFQMMMNEIVKNAIAENNQALGYEVSAQVGERVLKEMNYLMRDREEQEEERFRKLDEAIRSRQRRIRREKTPRKKGKTGRLGMRTRESLS